MSREEIQKLLGGYATDTLSAAERKALFEAALEDQELFDALARDEALRDVLKDASARRQLIAALGPVRDPLVARAWRWVRQPAVLAMGGGVAAVLIGGGLALWHARPVARREALVADAIAPQPAARPAPPVAALTTARPRSVPRKTLRPPTAQVAAPSAPLPAPPVLDAARPAALPLPRAGGAIGGSVQAGAGGAARDMMQTANAPASNFAERSGAPMGALKKAKSLPSPPANPAVVFTLLRKDADGAYVPVPSDTVFHAGDSVRLRVQPDAAGYIYLLRREQTGGWTIVEGQSVEKGQRYDFPATGGLQSDAPAQVELLLVFSRAERNTAVADALASQAPASSRITIEYR